MDLILPLLTLFGSITFLGCSLGLPTGRFCSTGAGTVGAIVLTGTAGTGSEYANSLLARRRELLVVSRWGGLNCSIPGSSSLPCWNLSCREGNNIGGTSKTMSRRSQ